jgi:DNA-directed RNA polymerase subunit RPC12/RpoP
MSNKKYECKRCGRPFPAREEEKELKCTHCGSKDVTIQPERPVIQPSCNTRGRFT